MTLKSAHPAMRLIVHLRSYNRHNKLRKDLLFLPAKLPVADSQVPATGAFARYDKCQACTE